MLHVFMGEGVYFSPSKGMVRVDMVMMCFCNIFIYYLPSFEMDTLWTIAWEPLVFGRNTSTRSRRFCEVYAVQTVTVKHIFDT